MIPTLLLYYIANMGVSGPISTLFAVLHVSPIHSTSMWQ